MTDIEEIKPINESKHWFHRDRLVKVPQIITWQFWIVKCCCTTVGETVSDEFNTGLGLGLGGAAAIFFPLLVVFMAWNFYNESYWAPLYWLNVILMSITGTIATDGLHDNLGLELWVENIIFFVLMCASFGLWYWSEGTIDIHSINTTKRECYYWLTVYMTFALGTAIGDGISEAAMLGYGPTFGLFVGCIVFFTVLWYFKITDEIASFWLIFIMTRPLGAALGDLLSSPQTGYNLRIHIHSQPTVISANTYPTSMPTSMPTMLSGGAGMGYGYTSVLFIGVITILVTWATLVKYDVTDAVLLSSSNKGEASGTGTPTKGSELRIVPTTDNIGLEMN